MGSKLDYRADLEPWNSAFWRRHPWRAAAAAAPAAAVALLLLGLTLHKAEGAFEPRAELKGTPTLQKWFQEHEAGGMWRITSGTHNGRARTADLQRGCSC
jgi:hypothetical protein